MGSIVLYIIEWAFALLVLLAIYKAAFSGTTLHRFNRCYLLGATLLSALLPLVHVTIPDSDSLVNNLSIEETEFAQELSGTLTFTDQYMPAPETGNETSVQKISFWAVALIFTYAVYVMTLVIGWTRGIIRARRFLRGKPRRRLSRTVWLVTHNEQYGPFSWMNYIVISDTESGFARRASLRHEYSHVRLMHSVDLIILLACTTVNPVCWLVLQEIKIVHEFEADNEVINRYGIQEQDYQRLLLIRTVGAEAYALASSFNLNIKKRIIMMNKTKTLKRRLMWMVLLIPLLGMTSVLFARSEKTLDIDPLGITIELNNTDGTTVKGKVVDEKGKPVAGALISESMPDFGRAIRAPKIQSQTNKKGEFSFRTIESSSAELGVAKEGYGDAVLRDYYNKYLVITLKKGGNRESGATLIKQRNLMWLTVKANGKVHAKNGVVNKDVDLAKLKGIAREFIANPKNKSKLPVVEEYDMEGFGTVNTTVRHVIALEREPEASIEQREAVYAVIMDVLYELRDEWCRKEFGTPYEESTPDQQGYARGMYPSKVSMAETRYYCDINLRIRRSAILAYMDKTDNMTGKVQSESQEDGQLLGVIQALEKYLDDITADGQSRIRGVKVILNDNADQEFVSEVKKVLRQRNIISINYSTEPATQRGVPLGRNLSVANAPGSSVTVSGDKPKAGDFIRGVVKDADGPMMLVNIYELSTNARINAAAITDMNGEFSMKLTNPDDNLLINFGGYYMASTQITGNYFEITLVKDNRTAVLENPLPTGPDENGVYTLVEDMPEFPGGMAPMMLFISQNIHYPAEAKANGINGRVVVQFTVNEDGHLSDFEVTKSAHELLDNEAVRMIKTMPNFKPGSQNGVPVKVKYSIPINFRYD